MIRKKIKASQMRQTVSFTPKTLDEETRTVELVFSSETEVRRWFGTEVLDHRSRSVDLSRLISGKAPLMLDHYRDQIGVVEKAEIRGKQGVATVRFSKVGKGAEIYENVKDGIMSNVSVGYRTMTMQKDVSNPEKPIYRAVKWQPYEISIVSVPADHTVGVRSQADDTEYDVEFIDLETRGEDPMPQPVTPPTEPNVNEPQTRTLPHIPAEQTRSENDIITEERTRMTQIHSLCRSHDIQDHKRDKWLSEGKSLDQVRTLILDSLVTPDETIIDSQRSMDGPIGSPEILQNQNQDYSFCRAINAQATGNWDLAGYEREVSQELARSMGKKPEGLYMPVQSISNRALTTQTGETGAYLVSNQLRPQDFIDLLRNRTKAVQLGARLLSGLQGDVTIPRMSDGVTAHWINENQEVPESTPNLGQIKMSPKQLAAYAEISKQMIAQSTPDVENLVREDIALAIAIALDKAILSGTGQNGQPTGIMNTTGVGTVSIAAGSPTFGNMVALETDVATANADIGNLAYLASIPDRGVLKTKEKANNTAQFVWEKDNRVNGYRAEATNQLTANQIIFGNWADIIIGQWLAMDIVVDPYSKARTGLVCLTAHQMADIAIRNAASFSYTTTD